MCWFCVLVVLVVGPRVVVPKLTVATSHVADCSK